MSISKVNCSYLSDAPTGASAPIVVRWQKARAVTLCVLVIASLLGCGWGMFEVIAPNGVSAMEALQLGISLVLVGWLCLAFWTAFIGFWLQLLNRDPLSLQRLSRHLPGNTLVHRHAIVMPVYNEDTRRIMSGFEACVRELMATPEGHAFDFFMLSDTQDESLARDELQGWKRLSRRLGEASSQVFYRRRLRNTHRKVGNLRDFCQRWGARYESMIVLDADSVMTANCMLTLARRLEANPRVGLLQTVPMPVRQHTFFGRFVQFAAHLYSPMLSAGLAFWQTDRANYWGHNAIIRIQPFMQHCGLPAIPGKGPFAGDILSHDFVEAALLRRAGWHCYLLTDVDGSFEEVPSNLVDYAVRDRRWVQGNLQHLALLTLPGLKFTNRLHFLLGAFAYLCSPLLLLLLLLGSVYAANKAVTLPEFFTDSYQLFPTWQVERPDAMLATTVVTASLLLLPKVLGLVLTLLKQPEGFGGRLALLKSALIECWFALLIAPLMMMFHSYFVLSVLVGKKVSWDAQARDGKPVPWAVALQRTRLMSAVALAWGMSLWYLTPGLLWWLSPLLLGMFLGAPIVRLSSSNRLGQLFRRAGLLLIGAETKEHLALKRLRVGMRHFALTGAAGGLPRLPAQQFQSMPIQPLFPRANESLPTVVVPPGEAHQ